MSQSRRSISKSPGPVGADEEGFDRAAYERRRQQVRRAQRSHRERKANHVKALEQEVVDLRSQNAQNIQEYEDEVRMLQQIIISTGMSPPPRQSRIIAPSVAEVDASNPSSFRISKMAGVGQALQMHVPVSMSNQSSSRRASDTEGHQNMQSLSGTSSSSSQLSPLNIPQAQAGYTAGLSEMLSPTSLDKVHGINFVLALESPCTNHADLLREEFGTHNHMASHNLLAYGPPNINAAASWEVPALSVESLLDWSSTLQLEGVLTPVQAWYRLKQHPFFPMVNETHLQQLRGLLASEVKCYGYGALIDERSWEMAIQTVMMPTAAPM